MRKVFLYDPHSVNKDTLSILRKKQYECIELTDNPDFFWGVVSLLKKGDIFVLLSHGDEQGPLPVKGNKGKSIDMKEFIAKLNPGVYLYMLSCHTGLPPCGAILSSSKLAFAAPLGCADFQTVGADVIHVFSKEGKEFPGWNGKLGPGRATSPLSLP